MDSTSHLATLPPEILQLIIEHTHASGHWPFAQTCKHIYLNSQPILDRHREAYHKFRISCDLDPETVPNLIWSALSPGAASINAWHVREFEVWSDRINKDPLEVDADTGDVWLLEAKEPWCYTDDDIDYFCNKLFKVPDFFPESDAYHDQIREELETGADAFLKSFLLAHLPRIQALRYARTPGTDHASFNNLCRLICWCELAGIWLPGLEALQKVYVGVSLRRIDAIDTTDDMAGQPQPSAREGDEFCALLCLPNLYEVYFAHLHGNFDLSSEASELFPDGLRPPLDKTSPVQTIIIDQLEVDLGELMMDFIAKTPRSLKNLAIRFHRNNHRGNGPRRAHALLHKLAQHQHSSLQRVCFHSADHSSDGISVGAWVIPAQLVMFEDLRVAYLFWGAIEDCLDRTGAVRSRSELLGRLLEAFRSHLPATMEIVSFDEFHQLDGIFQEGEFGDPSLDYVDDAVEAMITSERYKNLKAVYLQRVQEVLYIISGTYLSFPKAMKAAEKRGIYIHLKGSKPPPGLSINEEFVPIPTRDCMETGRFMPEDREHSYSTQSSLVEASGISSDYA